MLESRALGGGRPGGHRLGDFVSFSEPQERKRAALSGGEGGQGRLSPLLSTGREAGPQQYWQGRGLWGGSEQEGLQGHRGWSGREG